MKPLSRYLNEKKISALKGAISKGEFPDVSFSEAMEFLLSDGILPRSGLPASSFLKLEDWIRDVDSEILTYTTTELKNKTGEILDQVLMGKRIRLSKHGRIVAEIKKI